jgi:hypothetical protein
MFMRMKCMGGVKGQTVASGKKQRGYIDKEESSLLTVVTESVILTSMVDTIKRQHMAV